MSYRTEFLLKARTEILEAWAWYEDKQSGLGDKFKQSVYSSIRLIEQHPERYAVKEKDYRELLIKTFPYLIVYRIHKRKKVIAIVAVFHARLNPKKKHTK